MGTSPGTTVRCTDTGVFFHRNYYTCKCMPCDWPTCFWCKCCCFNPAIELESFGTKLGSVEMEWTFCAPKLVVKDNLGNKRFRVVSSCIQCSCGGDVEWMVINISSGEEIGTINKQFSGCFTECCTDADNYSVSFPMDLDVQSKAMLMATALAIDFLFYETKQNN